MRQIKNFMEAKRPMWNCNECKCITMQCWKESEAFCGCGEGGSPLPSLHNVIELTGDNTAKVLIDGEENYIEIGVEVDQETGDGRVVVNAQGIFADERYVSEDRNLWIEIFEGMDWERALTMIENYTEFPSDVFEALESFYKNPTETNLEAAYEALGNWSPLNNIIDQTSENSADVLFDGLENVIMVAIESDAETGDDKVVIGVEGIFADEKYISEGENLREELFTMMDVEPVRSIIENYFNFPTDVFEAFENFYENPTAANYEAAEQALGNWIPDPSIDFATIESDLYSLDAEQLQEQISEAVAYDPVHVFELLINENTYIFEPTSENSSDIYVNINGIQYETSVSIETDAELGTYTLVVGETRIVSIEDAPQSTPGGE